MKEDIGEEVITPLWTPNDLHRTIRAHATTYTHADINHYYQRGLLPGITYIYTLTDAARIAHFHQLQLDFLAAASTRSVQQR